MILINYKKKIEKKWKNSITRIVTICTCKIVNFIKNVCYQNIN